MRAAPRVKRPRRAGIVAAIHEDPAFQQRPFRGAEARREEGHPDQRPRSSAAAHDATSRVLTRNNS